MPRDAIATRAEIRASILEAICRIHEEQCELKELVGKTRAAIAESRKLLAKVDRVLPQKVRAP